MRTSVRGGMKAEVAAVAGIGFLALAAAAVLAVMGIKWFSGQLRDHASDPRVTLVGSSGGGGDAAAETAPEAAAAYSAGTLTDTRNSKKYKTVEIGGRVWMAENLNYPPDAGNSWCYGDRADNCNKYGRLYDWTAAMAACPPGWRLASNYDWDNLMLAIGSRREPHGSGGDLFFAWEDAGKKLKSKRGWKKYRDPSDEADEFESPRLFILFGRKWHSGNGTDDFGFAALPGGAFFRNAGFDDVGGYANWWTSTESLGGKACRREVNYYRPQVIEQFDDKSKGLSVRCVADSGDGVGNQFDSEERKKNAAFTREDAEQRDKAADDTVANLSDYFTDKRDGRVYRTVKIDSAKWMAENLSYKIPAGSWCYGDDDSNCAKYGRLYDWYAAATSCPAGWRLPSRKNWDDLGKAAGGVKRLVEETGTVDWIGAATTLKAKRDWKGGGAGTDAYGFSALPGGLRDIDDRYTDAGAHAYWWTADEYEKHSAYIRFIIYRNDAFDGYLVENALFRNNGLSVRCVAGE